MQADNIVPQMFRSEFTVIGDLVAATPGEVLRLDGRDGFVTTLRNAELNEHGEVPGLYAVVIGPAESLDEAMDAARAVLVAQLDVLAFTTHSRYRIEAPVRSMEWMPGLKKINITWFYESDERYPPAPELRGAYVETAAKLDRCDLPGYVRTALRAFRRGLLEESAEDQFMSFWLALEVVAENTKSKKAVPIPCSKCNGELTCAACGHTPTRVPMPKDQIANLIRDRTGDTYAADVAKGLFTARNGLMHGRSVESIEAECKGTMDVIANALANVVWNAIYRIIDDFEPKGAMLHREGKFLSRLMVVRTHGSFDHDRPEPYPSEGSIPSMTIRHLVEFRPLAPGPAADKT